MNIDSAREKFLLFLQNYEEYKTCDFSESDTRSKVIDKLFIDILLDDQIPRLAFLDYFRGAVVDVCHSGYLPFVRDEAEP